MLFRVRRIVSRGSEYAASKVSASRHPTSLLPSRRYAPVSLALGSTGSRRRSDFAVDINISRLKDCHIVYGGRQSLLTFPDLVESRAELGNTEDKIMVASFQPMTSGRHMRTTAR